MNLYNTTRDITTEVFNNILDDISEYDEYNTRVANSSINGSGHKSFKFSDGDRYINIGYIPEESGGVVNYSEPERVNCNVVAMYDDTAWFIPSDKVESISYLPELRQSFHEDKSFWNRDADYKYHFPNGDEIISIHSSNPVPRLDEPITIISLEYIGGQFPQSWILETKNNNYMYLRERSGSIILYDDLKTNSNVIFKAFVGGEHPGTHLKEDEVVNIITSVDYINIIDNPDKNVSEEAHEEYWNDASEYLSDSLDDI